VCVCVYVCVYVCVCACVSVCVCVCVYPGAEGSNEWHLLLPSRRFSPVPMNSVRCSACCVVCYSVRCNVFSNMVQCVLQTFAAWACEYDKTLFSSAYGQCVLQCVAVCVAVYCNVCCSVRCSVC